MKKQLAILGSTGSIGTQTLDVVAEYPDLFEVYTLTANNNVELLIEQAKRFNPDSVVIANEAHYPRLKEALKEYPIKVYAGDEAIAQIVEAAPIDIVVTAMVGYAGLRPTIRAIEAHKTIALANKETLVCAGQLVMDAADVAGDLIKQLALEYHAPIIPVDSEHSAIFQCLIGEWDNPIDKIILTASGGPFRELTAEQMKHVTKNDALKHPKWNMGHKITIDSATLMNKGFEMIEAKWLFDVDPKDIEIAVHPQSIVHSMVQFKDGTVKAQLGVQDMRLPIRYALSYPARLESANSKLTLEQYARLTFERPDLERFPLLRYAFDAVAEGGNMPCIMNAANEIAVAAFLHDAIDYPSIARIVAETMAHIEFIASPRYEDYVHTNQLARDYATTLLQ